MTDWHPDGLQDDMRPHLFAAAARGEACGLATIVAADGGPRPVGAQMVIDATRWWGFLSGGCIEADVALHGRAVLADGVPRRLIYGRGSPFIDMRLPCGGRLEVLVERVPAGDPAVARLAELTAARRPALWRSDGLRRWCEPADDSPPMVAPGRSTVLFRPTQRLLVIGSDPFALAMAMQGRMMDWEVVLIHPNGPHTSPPFEFGYRTDGVPAALKALQPDAWTAIAVATHDTELDHQALVAALGTTAGYVGVLGARRRLPERLVALREAGLGETALARLRAPIGLPIGAANAREVAVAVIAEIVADAHGAAARRVR